MDESVKWIKPTEELPFAPSVTPVRENIAKEEDLGPPEIPHNEFLFDSEKDFLGEGSFGKVYRGTCRGKKVAIKEPIKQELSEDDRKAFENEVRTMSKIFHQNVVLFMGACIHPDKKNNESIKICMEFCQTDLEKILAKDRKNKDKLTLIQRLRYAKDAALGMNWLHGINSIVHGDLKTANLLADDNFTVKVGDFGFACVKKKDEDRKDPTPVGTPLYMAPEVMSGKAYDGFKADVYSFGIILWEIYTSQEPFSKYSAWKPFKTAVMNGERPEIPDDCPPLLSKLMNRCWDENPTQRPSFNEILFRLDELLVDAQLHDKEAREFWKANFLAKNQALEEVVLWKDFREVLEQVTGIGVYKWDVVKKIFVNEGAFSVPGSGNSPHANEVSIKWADRITYTFGRFFSKKEAPKFYEFAVAFAKEKWYHGEVTRPLSEDRLRGREAGTFLIRNRDPLGPNEPGSPFALSHLPKPNTVVHRVIKYNPLAEKPVFSVEIQKKIEEYATLDDLLKASSLGLTTACPPEILSLVGRYGDSSK